MNKLILAAAVAASAFSFNAAAAELSFNNLNLSYEQLDFDCDTNCDGFGAAGSFEINDLFFVGADYFNYESDIDVYGAYLGLRREFSENAAVYGKVGLARASSDFGSSDTELALGVGLRGMITPSFELDGSVNYINADGSDPTANLTGTFFFTDAVGVSLSLDGGDGFFGGGAGLRFNF